MTEKSLIGLPLAEATRRLDESKEAYRVVFTCPPRRDGQMPCSDDGREPFVVAVRNGTLIAARFLISDPRSRI